MIRSWIQRQKQPAARFDPVAPVTPVMVVGDIHGRADLLQEFLRKAPDFPIICVGDYVDRGEDSAGVLTTLCSRADITCLSGNHEDMMLRFIEEPDESNARWLLHGGLQTLASFGIFGVTETSTGPALIEARDRLVDALGPEMLQWLNALPTSWTSGNLSVVHAGANPVIPMEEQSKRSLQWGHPDFLKKPRTDGMWVVHGHTIVDAPYIASGRIGIDTGAYATDRLTVALIGKGEIEFEEV